MPKRPQRKIQESFFQRDERIRRERSIKGRAEALLTGLRGFSNEVGLTLADLVPKMDFKSEKPRALMVAIRTTLAYGIDASTALFHGKESSGTVPEIAIFQPVIPEDREARKIRLNMEIGGEVRLFKVAELMASARSDSLNNELLVGLDEGHGNKLFGAMQRGVMDWERYDFGNPTGQSTEGVSFSAERNG